MKTIKSKTAYRWAAEHQLEIVALREDENIIAETSSDGTLSIQKIAAGWAEYRLHNNDAGLVINKNSHKSVMVLKNFSSQLTRELATWHELGHYIDLRQCGMGAFPILKAEARASVKAIKLMKKYGRWSEYKRQQLLTWYATYENHHPQKSYRHLIESA